MNYNFGGTVYEQEVGGGEGGCPWARPCDGCRAAPSVLYCRADAAYLCASCDARVHAANRVASRHERVRVCEACERVPAVLACRADAAALCAACDAQVHSANPLAGRHQRVPVVPLPAAAIPAASVLAEAPATTTVLGDKEEEVDSWLLLSKDSDNHNCSSNNNKNMYFGEVDEFFDLIGYNSYYGNHIDNNHKQYGMQEQQQQQQQEMQKDFTEKEGSECVVPSQVAMVSDQQQSGYGVVGAEQAASMTAGVIASTDSIRNMSCCLVFDLEFILLQVKHHPPGGGEASGVATVVSRRGVDLASRSSASPPRRNRPPRSPVKGGMLDLEVPHPMTAEEEDDDDNRIRQHRHWGRVLSLLLSPYMGCQGRGKAIFVGAAPDDGRSGGQRLRQCRGRSGWGQEVRDGDRDGSDKDGDRERKRVREGRVWE